MENESFLGRGWKFPPEFNNTMLEAEMIENEDDIKESLKILLSTAPGERIMQPKYGCGIKTLIFDILDETQATIIKDAIEKAILFFEPRINLEYIDLEIKEPNIGLLMIYIEYIVRTTNNRGNLVYPFYLREGTNIEF